MKALRLCMALFFTGLLIGCSSSSGGGGSTTSSSSSGGTSSSSSSSGGTPFAGLPLNVNFDLERNEFFGGWYNWPAGEPEDYASIDEAAEGLFLAVSDNALNPFYKAANAASRIQIESGRIRFGNAYWTVGDSAGRPSQTPTIQEADLNEMVASDGKPAATDTEAGVLAHGDIDLSLPYTITIEITELPTDGDGVIDGAGFQVQVDNNTTSSGNSVHGSASQLLNLTAADLEVGTLVINVPGAVTINDTPIAAAEITQHVGTPNSFLWFRCPSNCGNTTSPPDAPAGGIELSGITVELQDGGVIQAPRQVDAPVLAAGNQEIEVSWTIVGNATAYDVAYGEVNDPEDADATVIEVLGADADSVTLDGLTNGTIYFVFVRAKNAGGEGDYSNSASATPDVAPDTAPVVTLGAQIERLDVSWTAVTGAATYDIVINTTGTAPDAGDPPTIADIPSTTTSTIAAGLTGGTPYFVFVRGNNLAGNGPYGSETETPTAVPAASEDRIWDLTEGGEFEQAIYDDILVAGTLNDQRNVQELGATPVAINGLNFFQDHSGPVRHRGTENTPNRAWNWNGSSWFGSRTRLPANGELITAGLRYGDDDDCNNEVDSTEAGTVRGYIGVPVTVGAEVTITASHRHPTALTTALVAYVGDDDIVICQDTAEGGDTTTPVTTSCTLPDAHTWSEVRIFFSRECEGGGGLDLMGIEREYTP